MHAWTIISGVNIFCTHIKINDFTNAQDTLRESTNILKEKFNFYLSLFKWKKCLEVDEEAKDIALKLYSDLPIKLEKVFKI
jgi:cobalt-zinc-cadmium efflux system protein